MLRRILTSLVGIPPLVAILILGGSWLRFAIAATAIIGMRELFTVSGHTSLILRVLAYTSGAVYILGLFPGELHAFLAILALSMCCALVLFHNRIKPLDTATAFIAFSYVAFLLGFVSMVRELPGGLNLVWLVFISAWGSDTCAYFTGKTIGRSKLCPLLSPSKTVEGAIGGVLGAAILGYSYISVISLIFGDLPGPSGINTTVFYGLVSGFAAIASILGDLTASSIKRHFNVKDFGSIFPGHGGILDRFDSVTFAAPVIYIAATLA